MGGAGSASPNTNSRRESVASASTSRRGSLSPGSRRLSRRGSAGEIPAASRRGSHRGSVDPALIRRDSIEARRQKRTVKINETEFDYLPVRYTIANNKYNWRAAGLKTNIRPNIFVHHREELDLENTAIFQLALADAEAALVEKEKSDAHLTLEQRIRKEKSEKERRDSLSPKLQSRRDSLNSPRERGSALNPTVVRRGSLRLSVDDS